MTETDPKTGEKKTRRGDLREPFAALIPAGKHIDHARQKAVHFYKARGLRWPVLLGEASNEVSESREFCPECGSLLTPPRLFNLMFKTYVGPLEDAESTAYLRPETAQAIFAQFKNVLEVSRQKVPFGICQIGKAFRNEINPRNFTFRSREFEQMELEFFIRPDEAVEAITGGVAKASDFNPQSAIGNPQSGREPCSSSCYRYNPWAAMYSRTPSGTR